MLHYYMDDSTIVQYHPRYNVAPMQLIPAIVHTGEHNRLGMLRWGLLPSWSKEDKGAAGRINARAETLLEKPSFRQLVGTRRCIIPADGFYEWQKTGSAKRPQRITLRSGGIFSMAGLYDLWTAPDGTRLATCTIITTRPNSLMAQIHDRMPVILNDKDAAVWLNRSNNDISGLMNLLAPYPAEEMSVYSVSPEVGNVHQDHPGLIREA